MKPKRRPKADEPAPDFDDELHAGDLQIGSYTYVWLYDKSRKLPKRKQPFGFQKTN